jgi:glycosyltransferase involved in cell wall biosynthesis
MASGKPIVSNVEMSYCPITTHNLGISKEFKNAEEYSEAILYIYSLNKEKYQELCNNSLIASRNYNYEDLTNKYIDVCLND